MVNRYPPRTNATTFASAIILALAFLSFVVYMVFVFNSKETVTITVRDKERVCSSRDDCDYLIFTEQGVYENTDSIFAWKFNSSDLYSELEPGQSYSVDVWGFRNQVFSMYPNILNVN